MKRLPLLLALALCCAAPAFAATPAGTASLTWVAPTQNTDNTPLTNLAGYTIFQGTSPTTLAPVNTTLIGAGLTSFTITGLPVGTYYFGMEAVNSNGVASAMSAIVSATIVAPPPPPPPPNAPTGLTVTVTLAQ